jgi:hypothetical protein
MQKSHLIGLHCARPLGVKLTPKRPTHHRPRQPRKPCTHPRLSRMLPDALQYHAEDHENKGHVSAAKHCLPEPLQDNVEQPRGHDKRAKYRRWTKGF